jgi:acyl-CoA reductase-like NAD-dependent aldehyde dehydrogenase
MASLTGKPYGLLIGGEWVPGSSGTYGIVNPATEQTIDEAPEASIADAEAAAQAARDALPGWKRTSPQERANLLLALAEETRKRSGDLLPLIMAETGATLKVGSALQVPQAVARFERYAKGALQDISIALPPSIMPTTPLAAGGVIGGQVLRQPVGVVACISPYNFPLVNMAGKIGPALATGNTIVMKPAPQDPLAIIELAEMCEAVGFPPGVINVVTGTAPEVGQALVESRNVDMISFTGSTASAAGSSRPAGRP